MQGECAGRVCAGSVCGVSVQGECVQGECAGRVCAGGVCAGGVCRECVCRRVCSVNGYCINPLTVGVYRVTGQTRVWLLLQQLHLQHTVYDMRLGQGHKEEDPVMRLPGAPLHLVNCIFGEGMGIPKPNIELVRA